MTWIREHDEVAVVLASMLIINWPIIPWRAIEIVLPIVVAVFPFLFFPFSKLLWLAADLIMRPVSTGVDRCRPVSTGVDRCRPV
ncbi:MAG TPA: hypothetical protein VHV78_13440, partial [Gemmatimonadaceae bacterium]|nr:hypothetical protein [Gemmatimonadaceae bacterium]